MRSPFFFFFIDAATTEIYTLSLHDALPICRARPRRDQGEVPAQAASADGSSERLAGARRALDRSEEHTSELQSRPHLVCRLLLEKKNTGDLNVQRETGAIARTAADLCSSGV